MLPHGRRALDQRLQPTGGDHAGVDVDLGVRIDQGFIALGHDRLEEGHRGDRGGHALDEVDAVFLRPPLKNPPVGSTFVSAIFLYSARTWSLDGSRMQSRRRRIVNGKITLPYMLG